MDLRGLHHDVHIPPPSITILTVSDLSRSSFDDLMLCLGYTASYSQAVKNMHQNWSQRSHDPDKEVEKLFTQSFQVIQDYSDFIFRPFAQKLKEASDSYDVAISKRKDLLTYWERLTDLLRHLEPMFPGDTTLQQAIDRRDQMTPMSSWEAWMICAYAVSESNQVGEIALCSSRSC